MIQALIVDDELANRIVLESYLKKYCKTIEIIGSIDNANDAFQLINEKQPDLIFLDIKMPHKSGFDLLKMFEDIPFNVIFLTAHEEFAIQAFEFNALAYLLKPIDKDKLIKAVEKAQKNIHQNKQHSIIHFIQSIDEKEQLFKTISLHKNDRVQIIDINQISYLKANRNYTEVITHTNEKLVSTKNLLEYEHMLSENSSFIRINKSTIINIRFIQEYSKGTNCFIFMKNASEELEVSRRKKSEILNYLKNN